jgi:hypothetical protein
MTNHKPPVAGSKEIIEEADPGQRSTGEGAESAMAVLRDRREVDHLIAPSELDSDCGESPE